MFLLVQFSEDVEVLGVNAKKIVRGIIHKLIHCLISHLFLQVCLPDLGGFSSFCCFVLLFPFHGFPSSCGDSGQVRYVHSFSPLFPLACLSSQLAQVQVAFLFFDFFFPVPRFYRCEKRGDPLAFFLPIESPVKQRNDISLYIDAPVLCRPHMHQFAQPKNQQIFIVQAKTPGYLHMDEWIDSQCSLLASTMCRYHAKLFLTVRLGNGETSTSRMR